MVEAGSGKSRAVDQTLVMELAPEAATFYPPLPSRPLAFRDLLGFCSGIRAATSFASCWPSS